MALLAVWAGGVVTATQVTRGDHASEIVRGEVPGGPSTSQTIMVPSLRQLLVLVVPPAPAEAYRSAVLEDNALGKKTAGGREWAFRQLRRFYALNPQVLLFRALRDLWDDESAGQPLLALLCAMARDSVLRASSTVIVNAQIGAVIGPRDFEEAIEATFTGAYGDNTRRTTAQKLASSWAQAGHLHAEAVTRKVRRRVACTPAALAYALMLGHLQGARGQAVFDTLWTAVLDQSEAHLMELAFSASQRRFMEFRSAGGVVDVSFNELLRPFEGEPS